MSEAKDTTKAGPAWPQRFPLQSGAVLIVHKPNRFHVSRVEQVLFDKMPEPPTKEDETFFGKEERSDYQDLNYQVQMMQWRIERGIKLFDFYILEYVGVEGGVPDDLADLARTYERMARYGATPPYDLDDPDERHVGYVRAQMSDEESLLLQQMLKGELTKEEVAAAEATFPGDVPGATADE